MSDTAVAPIEPAVEPVKKRGRPSGVRNGEGAVKPPKQPKEKKAQTNKLRVIAPDEHLDTSIVPDDFDVLRDRARVAMGDYALESKADTIVASIKAKRAGTGQTHYVHPLDIDVDGTVNNRWFANDARRIRQIEFGNALAAQGIHKALEVFVKGDRLTLLGGETRLRSVLLQYVRGLVVDPKQSKIGMIPVQVLPSAMNDFDRKLRVATSNDQENFLPIEVACNIKELYDLLEARGTPKMEAYETIANAYGKTVTFVYSHLSYMELPSQVIGLLKSEPIAVSIAMDAWKKTKNDTAKTMQILTDALERSKLAGKKKVMPKHLEVVTDNTPPSTEPVIAANENDAETGTETTGDTGGIDTGVVAIDERRTRITESAKTKAQELFNDVAMDARFILTDDGFVRFDTSKSAPAVEWTVEDFTAIAKAFPRIRIPAALAMITEEDTAA
jgi:hypothetical protein